MSIEWTDAEREAVRRALDHHRHMRFGLPDALLAALAPHVEAMLDRARAEVEDALAERAEAIAERDRLAGEVETLRARLAAVEAWADVQARPFADGIPDREGEAVAASLRAALEVEP